MAQLEADALKNLQKHNMLKEVESDALVVTLDNELQALVKVSSSWRSQLYLTFYY